MYYKLFMIACITLLILEAFTEGATRIFLSNYNPINGDFQNYNAFRRILDGQVPFRDFSLYLGMGTIYLNVPLLFFHNTFTASLFISHFTAYLCFSLAVAAAVYLSSGNKYVSMLAALASGQAYKIYVASGLPHTKALFRTFPFLQFFRPGNSMRVERAFLPFLLVMLFFLVYRKREALWPKYLASRLAMGISGFVLGTFVLWSNDFGYACIFSFITVYVILNIRFWKETKSHFWGSTAILLAGIGIGFFLNATLVSGFHPGAVFKMLSGTAQYQFWYFGFGAGKMMTLLDIFTGNRMFTCYLIAFVTLCAYYLYKLIRGRITAYDVAIVFINISTGIWSPRRSASFPGGESIAFIP